MLYPWATFAVFNERSIYYCGCKFKTII